MDATNRFFDIDPTLTFWDRAGRFLLGMTLIGAVFLPAEQVGWFSLFALAAIPLILSALIGWDPIHSIFTARHAPLAFDKQQAMQREANRGYNNQPLTVADRTIRLLAGAFLIGTIFASTGPIGWNSLLVLLAIPIIATSIIAWCPCYAIFAAISRPFRNANCSNQTAKKFANNKSQPPWHHYVHG